MGEPIPSFAQEAYAVLYNRFGSASFRSDYLSWFVSNAMVKKSLHVLEKGGWIRRVGRGEYACVNTDEIFRSMVQYRVPEILQGAGMKFAYSDASAVEIWTDYNYVQRSWEHSPYYVKVLRSDLKKWIAHFRKHKVKAFVDEAEPCLGEFVVLKPQEKLIQETHNGSPVEPLISVVRYCERNIDAFEYPLAYLRAKFRVRTSANIDRRVLNEAMKAV